MTGGKKNRKRTSTARERRIFVRGVRREEPDLPKLARALLALAQREADAANTHAVTEPGQELRNDEPGEVRDA
jgi:hypothetical protein